MIETRKNMLRGDEMPEESRMRPRVEIVFACIIFIVFLCSLAAVIISARIDDVPYLTDFVRIENYETWQSNRWIVAARKTTFLGLIMSPWGIGFGVYVLRRHRACGPLLMSCLLVFLYFVRDDINNMRSYYDRLVCINRIESEEVFADSVINECGVEKIINGNRTIFYADFRYGFGVFGVDGNEIIWRVFSPNYSGKIIRKSSHKYYPEIQKIMECVEYLRKNEDGIALELSKKNRISFELALMSIRGGENLLIDYIEKN